MNYLPHKVNLSTANISGKTAKSYKFKIARNCNNFYGWEPRHQSHRVLSPHGYLQTNVILVALVSICSDWAPKWVSKYQEPNTLIPDNFMSKGHHYLG